MLLHMLLFATAVLIWLLCEQFSSKNIRRNGERLQSPPGTLPLAGYGVWFLRPRHHLLNWLANIQPRMGLTTYNLPVPSLPPAVLINDPVLLKEVLTNNELFVKGEFFKSRSKDLFRDGILNADGELWRIQRKAGLRFLSRSNLMACLDNILPPLLSEMRCNLQEAASESWEVDMQAQLLQLTTRFMGKIAFDMDIDAHLPFSAAFEYASAVVGYRFTNPLWRFKDFFRSSTLRPALRQVHSFGAALVEGQKDRCYGKTYESSTECSSKWRKEKASLVDELDRYIDCPTTVAAAAVNFFSAGRDTTAQAMSWTLYCLIRNPRCIQNIRLSLEAASGRKASAWHLSRLPHTLQPAAAPYMFASFAEALRLYPPVPMEIKETTNAVTLADGTTLPNGAVVVWCPYAMARNPLIWGADAQNYRPERWLESPEGYDTHPIQDNIESIQAVEDTHLQPKYCANMKTAFENPVFNAGPRMCIGKQLAELLAVAVISDLLMTFDFEEIRGKGEVGDERVGKDGLTMPIEGGLPVKVRQRT